MSTIALNSNNSNVRFILGNDLNTSLSYINAYKKADSENPCKLDGYIFFDLYQSRIYLNGKVLSYCITKIHNYQNDPDKIAYEIKSGTDTIIVSTASIGLFKDGNIIPAEDVQEGLMSKGDKVALEYIKEQLGFNVIYDGDNIKVVLTDNIKINPQLKWHDYN